MAKLVVLSEAFAGLSTEIPEGTTTVGRVEGNAFQVAHGSVSSRHCEIIRTGDEVRVRDLGSTNGSFIDGAQITESILSSSATLRLGDIELRLEAAEAAVAAVAAVAVAPAAPAPAPAPVRPKPAAPAAAAKSDTVIDKKSLAQTRALQGVKLDQLGKQTTSFDANSTTFFHKKSDKANKVFVMVGIGLAVVIIGLLAFAFLNLK